MKVKRYAIHSTPENEIEMIRAIQELKLNGTMWPNTDSPRFLLDITEEELLVLKLRVPCSVCD